MLPASTHLQVPDLVFISAIAGFIGARILHILDNPAQFMADPAAMVLTTGGFSIFGGLLILAAVLILSGFDRTIQTWLIRTFPNWESVLTGWEPEPAL